jgi:hypothetical protein
MDRNRSDADCVRGRFCNLEVASDLFQDNEVFAFDRSLYGLDQ